MKIWTTRGDGVEALALRERPEPVPGPHDVVVRLAAAALNFRDLLVVDGVDGWRPTAERVPLSDGVGMVVAVGAEVTRFGEGDRVAACFLPRWLDGELTRATYVDALGGPAADGVLAELATFHEDGLVALPPELDDERAATLPTAGVTAWHAVAHRCRVRHGDTVLIHGTGGVSMLALAIVAALGARSIVLSRSAVKLERARALGAWDVVDTGVTPAWEPAVLELTDGVGVDHVLETVGGANLDRSLAVVRIGGTVAFVGLLGGRAAPLETWRFVTKNVRLHGIETGSRRMLEELVEFAAANRLPTTVDARFEFGAAPDALRRLARGGHFGKLVVACD